MRIVAYSSIVARWSLAPGDATLAPFRQTHPDRHHLGRRTMLFSRGLTLTAVLIVSLAGAARADVRLPAIIGDNMVLQADRAVPIWGWADPGEEVTVTLGSAKGTA